MDPNDDPIYDEYTSSGNNVTEEDRHWNFNIGTDCNKSHLNMCHKIQIKGQILYADDMLHIICMTLILKSVTAGSTNTWFNKTESDVIEEIQQIDDSNQGKCSIMQSELFNKTIFDSDFINGLFLISNKDLIRNHWLIIS